MRLCERAFGALCIYEGETFGAVRDGLSRSHRLSSCGLIRDAWFIAGRSIRCAGERVSMHRFPTSTMTAELSDTATR